MDEAIIVRGIKEKKHILVAYEEHFGSEFNHSLVSKKKGKIKQDPDFHRSCMKPALDKWCRVSELWILNVIMMVVKENHLLSCNLKRLRLLDKHFSSIPKVLKWLRIDFHPL
jgi:hypothetical protein